MAVSGDFSQELIPRELTALNTTKGQINVYLQGNRWIAIVDDTGSLTRRVYRYCLLCGKNRFSDKAWEDQKSKHELLRNASHLHKCSKCSPEKLELLPKIFFNNTSTESQLVLAINTHDDDPFRFSTFNLEALNVQIMLRHPIRSRRKQPQENFVLIKKKTPTSQSKRGNFFRNVIKKWF